MVRPPKKQSGSFLWNYNALTIRPRNCILGCWSQKNENLHSHKNLYTNAHSSFIHKSQKLAMTQVSYARPLEKVRYSYATAKLLINAQCGEISWGFCQMRKSRSSKVIQKTTVSEDVRISEPWCAGAEDAKSCSWCGKTVWGSSKNQNHHMSWQFHLWVYFPKSWKEGLRQVFAHPRSGRYIHNCRKVKRCVVCVWYMHAVGNHLALKREETLTRAPRRVSLEDTTLANRQHWLRMRCSSAPGARCPPG